MKQLSFYTLSTFNQLIIITKWRACGVHGLKLLELYIWQ